MSKKKLRIALAGHANVGKSVIFNHLTSSHQHIGNWPGKTVEKAEGSLFYNDHAIDVIDLPGIYSLSTYSLEELIAREYIASEHPDFIINVIDSTSLERNLLFTLQLLELEKPLVLATNMVDLLQTKGITIDFKKLGEILGVPTVPTVATYGKGLTKILDHGIKLCDKKYLPKIQKYGHEVEERIEQLIALLKDAALPYAKRFTAIKLLEKDSAISELISKQNPAILSEAKKLSLELEHIHGHDSSIVIADERCHLVAHILRQITTFVPRKTANLNHLLDHITGHRVWGYPVMMLILGLCFFITFKTGSTISTLFIKFFATWQTLFYNLFGVSIISSLAWSGIVSLLALVEIAIPYVLPFYFILFFLESWGYLARIAYLMDNVMHKLGTHGKACLPLMLGFGCNVPACLACRIMETQREKFITGFLATFVPCSAVTVIVFGLVGKYVGLGWTLGLYLFTLLIIFGLGKAMSMIFPDESTALIMEMPNYKRPHLKTILHQTWIKLKEFILIASPIVIFSGLMIEAIRLAKWLPSISNFLSPITVTWLGLPVVTGIVLIFGVLRKELILVMLASVLGSTNFAAVLSPRQMVTLALISIFYIPCMATIAALKKEFGWKKALGVTLFKILFAVAVSGIILRLLTLFSLLTN